MYKHITGFDVVIRESFGYDLFMSKFFTCTTGIVAPIGRFTDIDKPSLTSITLDLLTQSDINDVSFAEELEAYGAEVSHMVGGDYSYMMIHTPVEFKADIKDLLDRALGLSVLKVEQLESTKSSYIQDLKELTSNDRGYAFYRFQETIHGLPSVEDKIKYIQSISSKDINSQWDLYRSEAQIFEVEGEDIYNIPKFPDIKNNKEIGIGESVFIDKESEQLSFFYGYGAFGSSEYDWAVSKVAQFILHAGLIGYVMEEIREKHSAAYYAGYGDKIEASRGLVYMYAGVSEENLITSIELMQMIMEKVRGGDIEDDRLTRAKSYLEGILFEQYSSVHNLTSLYISNSVKGQPLESLDKMRSRVNRVTLDEVVDFYNKVFLVNKQPTFSIYGAISEDTKSKLEEALKP